MALPVVQAEKRGLFVSVMKTLMTLYRLSGFSVEKLDAAVSFYFWHLTFCICLA